MEEELNPEKKNTENSFKIILLFKDLFNDNMT